MSVPNFVVFGSGPAGLMAADVLSQAGHPVTIYERMPSPARKFLLAGRGGLNLTHSESFDPFLARYREGGARLRAALDGFSPDDLRRWALDLGEDTFIGSSGRVFPVRFKASPLLRAWVRRLQSQGARLVTHCSFAGWNEEGTLLMRGEDGTISAIHPTATLLALGGASWPRLGSDGAWSAAFCQRGISVSALRPANCGFLVEWSALFKDRFEGTALKRIHLHFDGENTQGEALITTTGLEGGALYALSATIREAIARNGPQRLTIDLRPDLDGPTLTRKLAAPRGKRSVSNHLRKQANLSPGAIGLLREEGPLPDDPALLAGRIKGAKVRLIAPMPIERAISSAGGVALGEIDAQFMLVKQPGCFVAGEMLDWEAPTGGYLLQACFSTAVSAARGMIAYSAATEKPAGQKSPPGIG